MGLLFSPLLRQSQSPARIPLFPPSKKETLFGSGLGVHLLIPIRVDHKIIGLAMLAEKKSEDIFTDGEIQIFQLLSNQTALAIQNAKTYSLVKEKPEREQEKTTSLFERLARTSGLEFLENVC